jgi:hypothetical protein
MTRLEFAVMGMCVVLCVVALLGLVSRDRARRRWAFALYLGVVALADVLLLAAPSRFWNLRFWLLQKAALDLLTIAVAVQVAVVSWWAWAAWDEGSLAA